jgi:glucosamine--fructose-6-phosphate aminotransferase (isomerizing)
MCGIFGIILKPGTAYSEAAVKGSLKNIALFSESRGKDSSGIAFRDVGSASIEVIKGDIPVSRLLKDPLYDRLLDQTYGEYAAGSGFSVFGHARLVTNGSQLHEVNNQPVIKDGILVIHNGIIVNVDELWKKNPDLNREYKIDTEIIPTMIRDGLNNGKPLPEACNETFLKLTGTYSVAMMFSDFDEFVFATNNGSFYYITHDENYFVFASEVHFLNQLLKEKSFKAFGGERAIRQLTANQGVAVNMRTLQVNSFLIEQGFQPKGFQPEGFQPLPINKHLLENEDARYEVVIDPSIFINRSKEQHLFNLLEYNIDAVKNLKRCTKCLLPETFPFIEFDEKGVCNFCHHYKPKNKSGSIDQLKELVEPYRSPEGKTDCIVPFSGGRDSTYSLHIVKKVLGLHPIAFTYDWGMVTDLARRNIARVCGQLGVENIIVSADIRWKRENIRKNVSAWLKDPKLGMIPLFMAGDKYFFYYTNEVKKRTGIKLNIWGINYLENTEFKTGFAGLPPKFDKKRIYSLSKINQMKLLGYVGGNMLKNPAYLNQSVLDTFGSFVTRYISPKRDYYPLFDYYRWDEKEITSLITDEYEWERAIDTASTWRIGDGTASFYNYIYFTVAGFSENDTFRSNQIREGMIDRETALKLVEEENRPRYETMRWYLEIIGLDFKAVIETINKIPKLYKI